MWVVFLGRKSCPPALPVLAGVGDYPDLPTALAEYDWRSKRQGQDDGVRRAVIESTADADGATGRRDHLVSRRYRQFEPRYTRPARLRQGVGEV